jgi:phosphoribosylanthranilate isomerase
MNGSLRSLFARQCVVQIAGIASADEARMLAACGVDLLGFPLGTARGEGDVEEGEAAGIIRALRSPVSGILITYARDADEIARLCRDLGVGGVQLHGEIELGEIRRLKANSPQLFLVKTLVVRAGSLLRLVEDVNCLQDHVDAFLTDTFDGSTGRWGATGKTHDWAISRRIVEFSSRPVILAGGLTPENVRRAISEVRPAGVDAHTGVENPAGGKDRRLVEKFVRRAQGAFRGHFGPVSED